LRIGVARHKLYRKNNDTKSEIRVMKSMKNNQLQKGINMFIDV